MSEVRPEVVRVLDTSVYGVRRETNGSVVTAVKDIVLGTDGNTYVCFHQSTWLNGNRAQSPYYGFKLLDDDATPSPDEAQRS